MRIELVSGTDNVVRFPVERRARPTMNLLREIAPDVREVLQLVESFDLDGPAHDLRHRVDAEMAEHILNHVRPEPGLQRQTDLAALLAPVVARGRGMPRRARRGAGSDQGAAARDRGTERGRLLAGADGGAGGGSCDGRRAAPGRRPCTDRGSRSRGAGGWHGDAGRDLGAVRLAGGGRGAVLRRPQVCLMREPPQKLGLALYAVAG